MCVCRGAPAPPARRQERVGESEQSYRKAAGDGVMCMSRAHLATPRSSNPKKLGERGGVSR